MALSIFCISSVVMHISFLCYEETIFKIGEFRIDFLPIYY